MDDILKTKLEWYFAVIDVAIFPAASTNAAYSVASSDKAELASIEGQSG